MIDTIVFTLNKLAILYILILILVNYKVMSRSKHVEFILMLYSALLVNIGYLWGGYADSLEEFLLAQKVLYLLNLPMMMFLLFIIADVCNIKLSAKIKYLFVCVTIVGVACTMTIGKNQFFYKSIEFYKEGRFAMAEKVYGPGHGITTIIMMAYMVMSTMIALYALSRPKLSSSRNSIILSSVEILSLFIYFMKNALHISYEVMPYMHCVTMTVAVVVLKKTYLYDADRAEQQTRTEYKDSGILVFDNEKRFISANETARNILPQVQEYKIDKMLPSNSKGAIYFYGLMDELAGNPSKTSVEQFFDKKEKVYILRARRLHEENRPTVQRGYIIEIIDDTENQNYLRKIQRMNFDLENAIEEAESANAAKSNFLANMSHEIRTPINAVLGLNSIIIRDSKEPEIVEHAENIQAAGNSLLALINDILDFSKIEAGKMDIVPDKYGINSLINDCQNMLYTKFSDKNLEFKIENDETMPAALFGDEVRIRQICINLLNNAVKYTDAGSVTFKVGYKTVDDMTIKLCIAVSDTGQGISEENQKHLFENFRRIEEKRNKNVEGTGLGLALVKTLTELMNGEVFVESKEGVGSTFSVEIPQKIVNRNPAGKFTKEVRTKDASQKMEDLIDTEGTILVVDDVPMNLKVVKHLLAKSKLEVDTVESGAEALDKVKEKKYDIIFLDHMMPGMDGLETLQQMKRLHNNLNAETPVVMLTANAIEGVKEEYLREGFDEYLSKPVNFGPLRDVIKKYI